MTAGGAPAAGDPPGGSANVLVTVTPSDRGWTRSTLGIRAVPAIDPAATLRLTLTAIRPARVRPESYTAVPPPADPARSGRGHAKAPETASVSGASTTGGRPAVCRVSARS
ncbi:hypothetical protein GCM10010177_72860 [Actinomadura citrea]|nr:hypothetical protein GCM10010177_72860 [Actinomadura citrea]